MKHFIPVWLWLRFSSSARKLEVANNPMLLLPRMTRAWERLTLLWWGATAQLMFSVMWVYPQSFWYSLPLIASAGMLGAGLLGGARPSVEYLLDMQSPWDKADYQSWPRVYRLHAWQADLAAELIGEHNKARLEGEALGEKTPIPPVDDNVHASARRL